MTATLTTGNGREKRKPTYLPEMFCNVGGVDFVLQLADISILPNYEINFTCLSNEGR
jgi:hypothetical protein